MSNSGKNRQLLFIRPHGKLAAGFAKTKTPPSEKFKSLARNPFAGFLELSQDFFQFRKRKNDKWTPHPDAALFSEANKPPAISM